MQKPLRVILDFPASAPFFRVSSMVRELGKSGAVVAPAISLPDYDPDDAEQEALFNQLQQVGIRVTIPAQPEPEPDADDAMREQWQTAIDQSKPESAKNQTETGSVEGQDAAADSTTTSTTTE